MTDLTASRSAGWPLSRLRNRPGNCTDAYIAWLSSFSSSPSSLLCLGKRCQCDNIANLCLSTGEHRRTVYSRDHINLCCQRTDLVDGTCHPDACDPLRSSCGQSSSDTGKQPHPEQQATPHCQRNASSSCSVICADILLTLLLLICEYSLFHLLPEVTISLIAANSSSGTAQLCIAHASACRHSATICVDERDDLSGLLHVHLIDGLDHLCLRNLICACLDHDHLLCWWMQRSAADQTPCPTAVWDGFTMNSPSTIPICVVAHGPCKRDIGNAGMQ